MRIWIALGLCAGCSFEHGTSVSGESPDANGDVDARMIDAAPPGVFPTGPFGTPELVPISGASYRDDDITLTGDMLEIFFESDRVTLGNGDIYTSRRASVNDAWSLPARIDERRRLRHDAAQSFVRVDNAGARQLAIGHLG